MFLLCSFKANCIVSTKKVFAEIVTEYKVFMNKSMAKTNYTFFKCNRQFKESMVAKARKSTGWQDFTLLQRQEKLCKRHKFDHVISKLLSIRIYTHLLKLKIKKKQCQIPHIISLIKKRKNRCQMCNNREFNVCVWKHTFQFLSQEPQKLVLTLCLACLLSS